MNIEFRLYKYWHLSLGEWFVDCDEEIRIIGIGFLYIYLSKKYIS